MGHQQVETTKISLHADLALNEQAINRTTPRHTTPAATNPRPDQRLPRRPLDYADPPTEESCHYQFDRPRSA